VAAQVNLIADGGLSFAVHTAPAPDDVNWPALWLGWRSRVLRTVAIVLPVAAVMVFPIGICTGARRARPPRRAAARAARSARTLSACAAAGCLSCRAPPPCSPRERAITFSAWCARCGDAEMAWLRHAVTSPCLQVCVHACMRVRACRGLFHQQPCQTADEELAAFVPCLLAARQALALANSRHAAAHVEQPAARARPAGRSPGRTRGAAERRAPRAQAR
jgi:hypothetical protein